MPNKDTVVSRSARSERSRRNAEITWYAVLSVLAALVFASGVIATAALVPAFCSTCHGAERAALNTTAHKSTHCDACHGATTLFGLIDRRLTLVSMVGSQFTPGTQQVVAPVSNDLCLSCHKKDMVGTVVGRGIRMSHKEVIDGKWLCADCHATTAHEAAQRDRRGYSMDMCLECHSADPGNIQTCEVCHVGKSSTSRNLLAASTWKITHGRDWRKTHGLGNLKTCKACHEGSDCVRCHGIPVPHPDSFAAVHGREVVTRDTGDQACLTCHEKKACLGCHGMAMPHPDDFIARHAKDAERAGKDVCYRCHQQESCINCHTRHAHPGLTRDYIDRLRANPVPVP